MYKSKLQELCQQSGWGLPKYETTKYGLNHNPQFHATVTVTSLSLSFHSQSLARSSKEAQNDAARAAFIHFTSAPPPSTVASYPATSSALCIEPPPKTVAADPTVFSTHISEPLPLSSPATTTSYVPAGVTFPVQEPTHPVGIARTDEQFRDMPHLYKNQLQTYAQKRNLTLPVYTSERHGPPHATRFKAKVTIEGKTYESPEFFTTLNKAELAAARVALMSLLPNGIEQDDSSYKNLLQELAQKNGYMLPSYCTITSGEPHFPTFTSTVEIGGQDFRGQEARTKKQAELSAAKVAYLALNRSNTSQGLQYAYPASTGQEAPQLSSTSLLADLTAHLQQNVQPTFPVTSERVEQGQGTESCLAMGRVKSASGASTHLPEHEPPSHNPPSLTNLAVNSAIEHLVGMSSLCQNRIIVHPRKTEVTYPPGSNVLPMRDDNWVAVKVTPQLNQ